MDDEGSKKQQPQERALLEEGMQGRGARPPHHGTWKEVADLIVANDVDGLSALLTIPENASMVNMRCDDSHMQRHSCAGSGLKKCMKNNIIDKFYALPFYRFTGPVGKGIPTLQDRGPPRGRAIPTWL